MVNYKKILIVFLCSLFVLFILVNFSFAQRELEIPIPGMTTKPLLPEYIVGIYNFALMIIGIICFGALLYGGFRYLTSAGKPAAIADAKDQIFSALLGLIILFSSYIILTTINPELVIIGEEIKGEKIFRVEAPVPATVYKDFNYQGDSCEITKSDNWIEDLCGAGWNDQISSIKINDPNYALLIHEHINYEGKAQLIETDIPKLDAHMDDKTSSITLIKKGGASRKATLYDAIDLETSPDFPMAPYFSTHHPNFSEIRYGDKDFDNRASSISLEMEVIAILYEHPYYKGAAIMFNKDDKNFTDNTCTGCEKPWWVGGVSWNDVASSIQVVNGMIISGTLPYNNQADCETAGKKWCPKCSGYKINTWKMDVCVESEVDCGYTCSTDCGAGSCGVCERFDWSTCSCVPAPCCLKEGSLILTPEGLRKIEDLKKGDYVIGYESGEKVKSKILEESEHIGKFKLYFYKDYWLTGNHLIYTDDYEDFKPISGLSNITKYYEGKVYNIQTETKNYFGENDLLIHNK